MRVFGDHAQGNGRLAFLRDEFAARFDQLSADEILRFGGSCASSPARLRGVFPGLGGGRWKFGHGATLASESKMRIRLSIATRQIDERADFICVNTVII